MAKTRLCALITIRADTAQCGVVPRALRRRPPSEASGGWQASVGRELPEDRHTAVKLDPHRRAIVSGVKNSTHSSASRDLS